MSTARRRILVIDDTQAVHEDFQRILAGPTDQQQDLDELLASVLALPRPDEGRHRGWPVVSAYQGEEGVHLAATALAAGDPFPVAFVDMRMPPGWDGLTTINALWALDPALQVVICSAYSDHTWEEITARLDTRDRLLVLRKPFDPVEVLQLASTLVTKWEQTRLAAVRTRQLQEVVDRLPAALWIKDAQGCYQLVNRCFLEFTGLDRAEVLGRTEAEVFGPRAVDDAARRRDHPGPEEVDDPRFGLGRRLQMARFTLPGEGDEELECGLAQDVSVQRQLEQQLQQAQKMETIGRLVSGVAHDFNNLLTVIQGFADLGMLRSHPGDAVHDAFAHIHQAGTTAGELTRQLLGFTRRSRSDPVALAVDGHLAAQRTLIQRLTGPTVEVALDLGAPGACIRHDPTILSQIVFNLAANARDAMPRGGTLHLATALEEDAGGLWLALTVRDTGAGMSAEVKQHLFEAFFTTKEPGRGTGLGLAMVHDQVRQAGGTIAVASEPGQGTTFTLRWPCCPVAGEASGGLRPAATTPATGRILLVDDDPGIRALMGDALMAAGHTLTSCADGREARDHLATGAPCQLLITDLDMPDLDGRALLEWVRLHRPELPALVITSDGGQVLADVPVLAKPFPAEQLVRRVGQLLTRVGAAS